MDSWRKRYQHLRKFLKPLLFLAVASLLIYYFTKPEKAPFEKHLKKQIADVKLENQKGEEVSLRTLTTKKNSLIVLWAKWCLPCIQELPMIAKIKPQLEENGVQVILINFDGGPSQKTRVEVQAWLISRNLGLETYFDFRDGLLMAHEISALPFSLAVNEDNKIRFMQEGGIGFADLSSITQSLNIKKSLLAR